MAEVKKVDVAAFPGAQAGTIPQRVAPMLATLTKGPFTDPDWYFEPKLDGYRIVTFVRAGEAKLQTRNFQDYTANFPTISADMAAQPVEEAVFDGEIVALDEKGRPCFQCLQRHVKQGLDENAAGFALRYYVFDLLYLNGHDLTGAPQSARVKLLDAVLKPGRSVKAVSRLEGDGEDIFNAAVESGMEGVIAKRRDATYLPGKRSNDWLKIKATMSDEFVVAGYTAGQGARSGAFGSLVLAQYNDQGRLEYSGNVGTGFDDNLIKAVKLRLDGLVADQSPFDEKIPLQSRITWTKPVLVAEVKFAERTRDGSLRAPVFLRFRDDKPAPEVRRHAAAEPD
jgi:bifunctional non-homologous end joining protein LigD